MKLFIHAKPNAKKECVECIDETHFSVAIKEPPHEGKANKAAMKAIARFLSVPISRINIVSGFSSKRKTIEVT